MRQLLLGIALSVTVLWFLPQLMTAEEPQRGGPAGPVLFEHLDTNHDGVISADEVSAKLPEPLKAMLKAADKNGDEKVSLAEFTAALKDHPLPPPPHGMHGGMMPPGPPHGGPRGKAPDLKELFEKFDTDKDGKLMPEEFTEGMKQMHQEMMEQGPPMVMGGIPGAMPGHGRPMPHGDPAPCWMMQSPGDHRGPHDGPGDNPPPEFKRDGKHANSRIDELEARVKALEAKIEGK